MKDETNLNIPPNFKGQIQIKVLPTNRDAFNIGLYFTFGAFSALCIIFLLSKVIEFIFSL